MGLAKVQSITLTTTIARPYSFLTKLKNFLFPVSVINVISKTDDPKATKIAKSIKSALMPSDKEEPIISFPILQPSKSANENSTPEIRVLNQNNDKSFIISSSAENKSTKPPKPVKVRPKQKEIPYVFNPTFIPKAPIFKHLTKKYLAQCTEKISSFRSDHKARFEKNDTFVKKYGFSRSLLGNQTRKFFRKRLVRGRPVFPPPLHISLTDAEAVKKELEANCDNFINDENWWEEHVLPDAIDKERASEGPSIEKYNSVIGTLAENAPELIEASKGVPQFLGHIMDKKKHVEALSLFSTEFVTFKTLDLKIQEAIDNPTSFNVPVEEMLKEQYKTAMIFKAVSDKVDQKTGFSIEKLQSVPSRLQEKKEKDVLSNYQFPSR